MNENILQPCHIIFSLFPKFRRHILAELTIAPVCMALSNRPKKNVNNQQSADSLSISSPPLLRLRTSLHNI